MSTRPTLVDLLAALRADPMPFMRERPGERGLHDTWVPDMMPGHPRDPRPPDRYGPRVGRVLGTGRGSTRPIPRSTRGRRIRND